MSVASSRVVPDVRLPEADASLDTIYAAVPRRSADEGYDSDEDTMPTLMTVEGSSDGEVL